MHKAVPIFLSLVLPFFLHGCDTDTAQKPATPQMPEAAGARWVFIAGDPANCRMKAKISGAVASFKQQQSGFVLQELRCADGSTPDVKSTELKATVSSCDAALTHMIHNEKYDFACGSCKIKESGWPTSLKAAIRRIDSDSMEATINCKLLSREKFKLNPKYNFCSFDATEKKEFFNDARIKCKKHKHKSKYFASEDEGPKKDASEGSGKKSAATDKPAAAAAGSDEKEDAEKPDDKEPEGSDEPGADKVDEAGEKGADEEEAGEKGKDAASEKPSPKEGKKSKKAKEKAHKKSHDDGGDDGEGAEDGEEGGGKGKSRGFLGSITSHLPWKKKKD